MSNRIRHRHALQIDSSNQKREHTIRLVSTTLALLAVTLLSYWATIADLFKEWQRNDDYSAGQLVPLIALFLVWRERKTLNKCLLKPYWPAIALLILAQTTRIFGLLFMYESAERYSLVLTITGTVLMVAGWQMFRSVSWILLFLFLMVPFPGRIHNLISGPLQRMSTTGSVFLLEAFGARVSQQGNVVTLNENIPMAVAEACSGLRMLIAFIIVTAFIAYMVNRSRKQKAVLLLSSIPVAVMCNILRICVTAILFLLVSTEVAEKFFHDFAGLAMMPAAVLLIFSELWLMDKLTLPDPDVQKEREKSHTKSGTRAFAKLAKKKEQHV
ncbi:MAG: exosortase/archaeosortase family protein [Sedimentisphaerales bacterium]|nr:exosortase/archaeosortase family protein [Sedimentisphaerales bacterium]